MCGFSGWGIASVTQVESSLMQYVLAFYIFFTIIYNSDNIDSDHFVLIFGITMGE